jgi:hypothetical protein
MDHIDTLRLSDVRLYRPWTTAPLGAILQMKAIKEIIVGMRSRYKTANAVSDAIVVLGGDRAGELITDQYLVGAALDVSSLVELIAIDAVPFECREGVPLPQGASLRHAEKEGTYFVWTMVHGGAMTLGGLCVASDDKSYPIGTCDNELDKNKLIGVAQKTDLRLREIKLVQVT